jgi:hypothetical protein
MTIRLSPEARRALSREITNHDRWTRQYRDDRDYSLATMTRDDYLRVAEDFGIDVQAIVDRAASSDAGQSSAKAERAASSFSGKADLEALGIRHGADVEATSSGRSAAFEARAREQWAREAEERREAGEREARSAEFKNQYPETLAERAPKTNGHDNSAAGKLMALIAELSATNVNPEQVRAIVNQELAPVLEKLANAVPTIRIELTDNGVKIGEIEGHKHPKFARLLRACSAKDATGIAPNVWIAGPAGSGKTYAAKQVAKALGRKFHFNGAIGMAHELLGFTDANGVYHRTPFRDAYEHGGIYLFDEVDGSDNAALLALNAALANGIATFPDGQVERHPECIIIATGNTWGLGATADYVGRSKIDAAFLDRFGVKIQWDYDEVLERETCGNPDFARRVQRARSKARAAGLKVLITPRASIAGAALIAAGASPDEAAEETFLANLTDDQRVMVS